MKQKILYITLLLLTCPLLKAQNDSVCKYDISGYNSNLQWVAFDSIKKPWITQNEINNRINFSYTFSDSWQFYSAIRNKFHWANNMEYTLMIPSDNLVNNGIVDAQWTWVKEKSFAATSMFDRFLIKYEHGKTSITLGRQRINWSQTLVWNPNDIFNAYSFFDIDYIERPGCDAIRWQYFPTEVSTTEIAAKVNRNNEITAAALYRFNFHSYDVQFIGGMVDNSDWVLATGWSGSLFSGNSFRGEISYFQPKNSFDSWGELLASISVDYTFKSSLTCMIEYLYTSHVPKSASSFLLYYSAPIHAKNLSFVRHNLVAQVSYAFTPLINGSLAGLYLPSVRGYYFSPGLNYYIANNFEASIFAQIFGANIDSFKLNYNLCFLRMKWYF